MKKVYLILALFAFFSANAQIVGTWKLKSQAGALAVGPTPTDLSWWQNNSADIDTRACLFDDSVTFTSGGDMLMYLDGNTWLEPWQGVAAEQCGAPVAPHDGLGTYTYTFDANTTVLTVNGLGAYLGLAKVNNGAELTSPSGAVNQIIYFATFSNNDYEMTLVCEFAGGYWRFIYERTDAPVMADPNVTFQVDMSQYTGTIGTGVFLNGDFNNWCGECTPMTNAGNNIWTVTVPIAAASAQYKFTIDGWTAFEEFTDGTLPCIDQVADGFNNRFVQITGDMTLPVVCFNSCTACPTTNSISENEISVVSLYPNPAKESISIVSSEVINELHIFSMNGNLIGNVEKNFTTLNLNTSKLPVGSYVVKIVLSDRVEYKRLVIE